ncbi:glycosyltransferase family 2 protein [uncultured Erythrobacter sp.]|uniref:glycosyltransferase family 2 protein n=1 Tax=uncultured Erythrobacter sp. TaxID=263913 RepID=UPI00265AF9EF|nr:glycosyltransferase family 2 protein [uncultured Erythrobacter sp.]
MTVTVIILTKNEAMHIERAIASIATFADRCMVVDSGSTDNTVALAEAHGAQVVCNPWTNYATQFNWALSQLDSGTDWVLRLDADEIISEALAEEIARGLSNVPAATAGIFLQRRMTFMGQPIRYGGVFPLQVLRLFRYGAGRCENRWMDEHIIVDGPTQVFKGELLDDNLHGLTWWTDKHNHYASREVIDLLNLEFGFIPHETVANLQERRQVGVKRWIKEHVYARLPGGSRAFLYFLYRYVIRFGFLDGKNGTAFHVLQGFWYRYLVDAKITEVRSYMQKTRKSAPEAIKHVLGIDVSAQKDD